MPLAVSRKPTTMRAQCPRTCPKDTARADSASSSATMGHLRPPRSETREETQQPKGTPICMQKVATRARRMLMPWASRRVVIQVRTMKLAGVSRAKSTSRTAVGRALAREKIVRRLVSGPGGRPVRAAACERSTSWPVSARTVASASATRPRETSQRGDSGRERQARASGMMPSPPRMNSARQACAPRGMMRFAAMPMTGTAQ